MIELLITLVLMMVMSPFFQDLRIGGIIEALLLTLVLIAAVIVIGASRGMRILAVVLAIPAVIGKWINHFRPDLFPVEITLVASLLFVAFVVVHLLRFTLRAPRVNVEVLCAAISNYLMIGLMWVFAYQLAAQLVRHHATVGTGPDAGDRRGYRGHVLHDGAGRASGGDVFIGKASTRRVIQTNGNGGWRKDVMEGQAARDAGIINDVPYCLLNRIARAMFTGQGRDEFADD